MLLVEHLLKLIHFTEVKRDKDQFSDIGIISKTFISITITA